MTDYSATGDEFLVNTTTANDQSQPTITGLGDGGFVVSWMSQDGSGYGIYAQRYNAAGATIGAEFRVNTITANDQANPTITALGDGGFVVSWMSSLQDGSGWGIYAQRYDAAGATVGVELRVNTTTANDQYSPAITALGDGGFIVSWHSNLQDGSGYGVYAQRYDAAGATIGGEFRVNTTTASDQDHSAITALGDGGFVVSWMSNLQDGSGYGIYAQRYNAAGATIGAEFRVNTITANDQANPTITAVGDGGFVVSWTSFLQDGSGYGIYAQRYGASGATVGNEFLVNSTTAGNQYSPAITALEDGGFVIGWHSYLQDGSGWGIYAQRYDASGAAAGSEFLVNTTTASDQLNPAITALDDGGFVVSWSSSASGNVDIYARIYEPLNSAPSLTGTQATLADGTMNSAYVVHASDLLTGFTDPDGDPLSISNISADHGAIVDNGDGTWTVTPAAGFTGDLALNYDVVDGQGDSVGAHLSFAVIPFTGGPGNDVLVGTADPDILISGGGKDSISGGNGDDLLVLNGPVTSGSSFDGGTGQDTLQVTLASASLVAAPGLNFVPLMTTALSGIETLQFDSNSGETLRVLMNLGQASGLTTLEGGAGTDVLVVSVTTPGTYTLPAFNLVNWTDGTDLVVLSAGNNGNYTLNAADHAGSVVMNGGSGNDFLKGSDGVETLNGNAGNDELDGGLGNDVLNGGAGADILAGDDGDDTLTGGSESDIFSPSLGHDIVTDFVVGTDKIDLRDVHFMNFAELQPYLSQSGNDVVWSYLYDGVVNTLTLQNVQLADLTANDFLFANSTDPVNVTSVDNGDDLHSTDNADVILGMNGNDVIDGAGGNDQLLGYGGDDQLIGGNGDDILSGGSGNDALDGGSGNDTVNGDDGNDALTGGEGQDEVFGGAGDDTFVGNMNGLDYNDGGTGFNTLDYSTASLGMLFQSSEPERFSVYLGDHQGQVLVATNISEVIGTAYNDSMTFDSYGTALTVIGGDGNDSIVGTAFNDTVSGGNGDDVVNGGAGNDSVAGDGGNDTLSGGSGNDQLIGGDGNDTLYSGGGLDNLQGGNGDDLLIADGPVSGGSSFNGGAGQDTLQVTVASASFVAAPEVNFVPLIATAFSGIETLQFDSNSGETLRVLMNFGQAAGLTTLEGGAGTDALVVSVTTPGTYILPSFNLANWTDGTDTIVLTAGNSSGDFMLGAADHAGSVVLIGGSGNDRLEGEAGNDLLNGGAGADILEGDDGNDVFIGGMGSDVFIVSRDHDTVTDFAVGIDKIDLRDVHFMNFAELQPYLSQSGNDVVWSYLYDGVVNTLTLQNVQLADLTANDFLFANPTDPVNVTVTENPDDDLRSTENADVILGMNGNDVIDGAGGNDQLIGYGGDDQLIGGAGADTLTGGSGNDSFIMTLGDMSGDRITDYQYGEKLVIDGAPGSASSYKLFYDGADTHLLIDTDGDGNANHTLILSGHVQGAISVAPGQDGTSQILTIEESSPKNATFTLLDPAVNDASVVHYLVTFEAPTAGVDANSFTLVASGITGTAIDSVTAVSGSNGTQYEVAVETGSGNGSVSLGLRANFIFASQPSTNGYTPSIGGIGDVNGDGKADLVLPNYYSANVAVMLGEGNGTFLPAVTYSSASMGWDYSNYARLGDFNNDGKLDILTTNYSEQSVSVLLGNGDGTFQARIATSVGFGGDSPLVVDVDGDGNQDILMGGTSTLAFLKGTGTGSFAAPEFIGSAGLGPYTYADINGDGKAEIVVKYSDHIAMLDYNGDGSFSSIDTVPLNEAVASHSLLASDVNADGLVDLVYNDYSGTRIGVVLNAGDGNFAPDTYYSFGAANPINLAVSDTNGDGNLDVIGVGEGGTAILFGNGDGTFAGSQYLNTGTANRGTFGDINGDGKLDFATINWFTSQVNVLLGAAGDEATYTISKNDAPHAQDSGFGLDEDTSLEGQLSATDDNPLTYSMVDGPQHGQLALSEDGSFEYTPDPDFAGLDQFTWRASDGSMDSNVATVTLTVNPVNDAPTVEALAFTGTEDQPLTGQLTASDVEADAITYTLVDGPQYGEIDLNPDGSFTYTPAADLAGEDSFTFIANDGQADSAVATVTLSIAAENDVPLAEAGATSGDEDTEITGQVSAVDPDGDPLSYAVTSDAAHGQVVMASDGSFSYTPEANYFGEDSFTFVANDGTSDSAEQTFTITVNPVDNDPAVITGDLAAEITESSEVGVPDGSVVGQLTATDPDGETSFNADTLAGIYGSFSIDVAGAWLYTLDETSAPTQALHTGDTVTDSFVITTLDGTEQTVTVTVHGVDDAAIFGGELDGTVTEAATLNVASQVTGTLTVSDPDDSSPLAAQIVTGQYGTLTLSTDGKWTYVLDNSTAAVDGLSSGENFTDTVTVSAVDGTEQNITITIAGADDVRNGTNAADTLIGTSGNDTLNGNGGNDTLLGGLGNDVLNGGNGTDTASYAGLAAGVTVSLAIATAQNTGGGGTDTLNSIENLIGTGQDDVLSGNGGANSLTGGDGNDVIDGGAGADALSGGNGTDTASYASATAAVTVSLASQGSAQNTGAGNDTLTGFENLLGSAFNDILTGDAGTNAIDGGQGNDTLNGGLGDDMLIGGGGIDTATFAGASGAVLVSLATGVASGAAGNDTLFGIENLTGSNFNDMLTGNAGANLLNGGAGDDTLDGGAGDDTLNGGTGIDTASYGSALSAVTVNLAINAAQNTLGAGIDILSAIENLTGSAFDDHLTGSGAANMIDGGDGNDVIDGGGGADVLVGGLGTDTVSYASAGSTVVVNLATGAASGGGGTDTLTGFENLTGSASNDTLTGDANVNLIAGGSGNDVIVGGLGNDTLNGESGTDTASYANASGSVTVNLLTGSASGADGNDILISIENLIGSNSGDTLTGDTNANTLNGGNGDDLLDGGAGGDILTGGAGIDTVSYASASSAVTVSLAVTAAQATGGSGSDTLSGIENLIGSAFNDTLTGSSASNTLDGAAGNDRLVGGAGADTLIGGAGNDTFAFTATANSTPAAFDSILDFVQGADKIELSGIDARPGGADNAFVWGGTTATAYGVWYAQDAANNVTHVYADTSGDHTADFQIDLVWQNHVPQNLAASDFIL